MFDYPKLNEALSLRLKQLLRTRVRVRIEDSHVPLVVIYFANDVLALQGDEAAQLIIEAEILEEAYDLYRCDALLLAAADYIETYA
jgi:NAD kinase